MLLPIWTAAAHGRPQMRVRTSAREQRCARRRRNDVRGHRTRQGRSGRVSNQHPKGGNEGSDLIDTVELIQYPSFWYNVHMRKNRVIEQNRCYHLVSRLAHRALFLDDEEKDRAVALMRRVEAGIQVSMSYCINRAVSISSDPFGPLHGRRHRQ